jgi:hypothetical protein
MADKRDKFVYVEALARYILGNVLFQPLVQVFGYEIGDNVRIYFVSTEQAPDFRRKRAKYSRHLKVLSQVVLVSDRINDKVYGAQAWHCTSNSVNHRSLSLSQYFLCRHLSEGLRCHTLLFEFHRQIFYFSILSNKYRSRKIVPGYHPQ